MKKLKTSKGECPNELCNTGLESHLTVLIQGFKKYIYINIHRYKINIGGVCVCMCVSTWANIHLCISYSSSESNTVAAMAIPSSWIF